jgi:hypothetical protein
VQVVAVVLLVGVETITILVEQVGLVAVALAEMLVQVQQMQLLELQTLVVAVVAVLLKTHLHESVLMVAVVL